jgi:xylulokinase
VYLGIDIGTSALKALVVDDEQRLVAEASQPLSVSRPEPLWSEQDPTDWWRATETVIDALRRQAPAALAAVRGIGLTGQMHGATLLDAAGEVLRPAILWNDGRSSRECVELEAREPNCRAITGNLVMPGFTAPKLLWVARHESDTFRRITKVLLPKDYVRWRLSGEWVSDVSDAAGTLWLDVAARRWSPAMLAATGLSERNMPRLCEGSDPSALLRSELAARWGMRHDVVIAGGAGDNAAGAAGAGVVEAGQAFLSLGTSGVYFVANAAFTPYPQRAVHAFCHCLPGLWHQMSVILSAASCLTWVTRLTAAPSEAALLAQVEADDRPSEVLFLPYLSGERTPHNDPHAKGVFCGLHHGTSASDLCRAVLEGVAFALAEGQDALLASGTKIEEVTVIGGGARSDLWGRILASVLDRPLLYRAAGAVGPAFGAARLARLAVTRENPAAVCTPPPVERHVAPDASLRDFYAQRRRLFADLYSRLRETFQALAPSRSSNDVAGGGI